MPLFFFFIWKLSQKKVFHGTKYSLKIISGKFGEIRAKIFRTPKILPAPTPTVSFIALYKAAFDRLYN